MEPTIIPTVYEPVLSVDLVSDDTAAHYLDIARAEERAATPLTAHELRDLRYRMAERFERGYPLTLTGRELFALLASVKSPSAMIGRLLSSLTLADVESLPDGSRFEDPEDDDDTAFTRDGDNWVSKRIGTCSHRGLREWSSYPYTLVRVGAS